MKAKLNFRSVVFKRAYILVKQTGCSFSDALIEAWRRYREFKTRTVEELTIKIKGFDFYYQMSTDGRTYRHWSSIQDEIRKQLKNLPSTFTNCISQHLSNSNQIRSFI